MTLPDIRYDAQAIDHLKAECNRLYELWRQIAAERTVAQGRDKMMLTDVNATRYDAIDLFMERKG